MCRFLVARLAQNRLVCSFQREARHCVMIESGNLPILAVMAFRTFRAIAPLVFVILLMATNTRHGWGLDGIIYAMAPRTGRCLVCAH